MSLMTLAFAILPALSFVRSLSTELVTAPRLVCNPSIFEIEVLVESIVSFRELSESLRLLYPVTLASILLSRLLPSMTVFVASSLSPSKSVLIDAMEELISDTSTVLIAEF